MSLKSLFSRAKASSNAQRQAFEQLLETHRGILLKVTATYCWNLHDRQELLQEMQYQLWRAYPDYDAKRSVTTWIYQICLNVAISYVRQVKRRQRVENLQAVPEKSDPESGRPEAEILLQQVLQQLKPIDCALLLLHLEGHPQQKIAEIIGTSAGNVSTRLHRIRQQIAKI